MGSAAGFRVSMHDTARLAAAFSLAALLPPLCPAEQSVTQALTELAIPCVSSAKRYTGKR